MRDRKVWLGRAALVGLLGACGGISRADTALIADVGPGTTVVLESKDNPHYLAADTTTTVAAGGKLVCRKDVVIKARQGARLVVYGELIAFETILRSWASWDGIVISGPNATALLRKTEIINAGHNGRPALSVIGTASATIDRCTVSNSGGAGILVNNAAPRLLGTTITKCAGPGIRLDDGAEPIFPDRSPPTTFTRNGFNGTQLDWPSIPSHSYTLKRHGQPYVTRRMLDVGSNDTLKIEPGVTIQFGGRGVGMIVDGTLEAIGTPGARIVFTAIAGKRERGGWRGIEFRKETSSSSILEHCLIQYGSGANLGGAIRCNGTLGRVPRPTLRNCEIKESGGYGIRSVAAAPVVGACTIHHCTNAAVLNEWGGYVDFVTPSKAFANGSDTVNFVGPQGITFEQTWKPAGFPYEIWGHVGTHKGGKIIIKPGVTLNIGPNVTFTLDKGPILAEGTAAKPIEFETMDPALGGWGGIHILAGGAGSTFKHCVIRGGGANGEAHILADGARRNGGVTVENTEIIGGGGSGLYLWNSVVTLTDSKIRKHHGVGIVAASNTRLTIGGSSISRNALDSVFSASGGPLAGKPPADGVALSNSAAGLYLWDAVVSITDSRINSNRGWGIVPGGYTQLVVQGTAITDHSQDGIYNGSAGVVRLTPNNNISGNRGFEIVNASSRRIVAINNWWGRATAKAIERRIFHKVNSPAVGRVVFDPFLTSAPLPPAVPPVSASGTMISSATARPLKSGLVQVTFVLSADADVQAEVVNIAGRPVRRIAARTKAQAGTNVLLWDQKSDTGVRVPNGLYLVRLQAISPSGATAQAIAPVPIGSR